MPTFFGHLNRRLPFETKVSLKAETKRFRKQAMLFCILFALLTVTSANRQSLDDFKATYEKQGVDISAIKTCWVLGGDKIDQVDSGNVEKGHKCKVTLKSFTANDKHAKEFCESQIPYYIIGAKPGKAVTECTFQMNLQCELGYWQIKNKCYKASDAKYTWTEAQNICEDVDKDKKARVAEYYSRSMTNYFKDLMGIGGAWVHVPSLEDYFENGEGNAAVYIQDGAYRYDARPGDIIMDSLDAYHQVICEYTPPMTMAEMFYIGEIYSEIYPISVYQRGAIIPSASFMTIKQTEWIQGKIGHYSPEDFNARCLAIGAILNVESFPITAIEEEFNDVKDHLKEQNFYLTNAFKNDGCRKGDYKQLNQDGTSLAMFNGDKSTEQICEAHSFSFHRSGRFPTLAAMRAPVLCALHTFDWNFGKCPPAPKWSEPVIRYVREDKRVFCHYINNNDIVFRHEAIKMCEGSGLKASLGGFDEADEFQLVKSETKPQDSKYIPPFNPLSHYWLGGQSPCQADCYKADGTKHKASWNSNVAVNNNFLSDYNHAGFWEDLSDNPRYDDSTQYLSFFSGIDAFHLHTPGFRPKMFFICGRSAPMVRGERKKAGITQKG